MRDKMLKKIKKQLKKQNKEFSSICPYCELKATVEIWTDSLETIFNIEDVYCNKGCEGDLTNVKTIDGEYESGLIKECPLAKICYSICKVEQNE